MGVFESYPRITPFLWFDQNAGEAADFYVSVFPNSRRLGELRGPDGKVITVSFELDGLKFTALNAGPEYPFTEAISFVIRCDNQQEIDEYWAKLTDGGREIQCGLLKDRYGLAWQVVPARLPDLLEHPKALEAMYGMKKLDIAALERAAAGA